MSNRLGVNDSVATASVSESGSASLLEPPKKKLRSSVHRNSMHRESYTPAGDLRASDGALRKEAEGMTYKNLRTSVADNKLSFRKRAKAKDEFRLRYKQNKWTYVWSLVATYSLIMVITLMLMYLNAPDEHCYYDSSL
jgi:hypothetical protein